MFKHGFRQVPAIFQDLKIPKSQKLIKNQETKVQEYYHDAEAGKNKKHRGVEPPKGINHTKSAKIKVKRGGRRTLYIPFLKGR